MNCDFSSIKVRAIPSSFGNVLATLSGGFTKMSTKIPSHSNQLLYSLAKSHGIIAENELATILSINGKCNSKPQTVKKITS